MQCALPPSAKSKESCVQQTLEPDLLTINCHFHRRYRCVPWPAFRRCFASDRRHMRTSDGCWQMPPPHWSCIFPAGMPFCDKLCLHLMTHGCVSLFCGCSCLPSCHFSCHFSCMYQAANLASTTCTSTSTWRSLVNLHCRSTVARRQRQQVRHHHTEQPHCRTTGLGHHQLLLQRSLQHQPASTTTLARC